MTQTAAPEATNRVVGRKVVMTVTQPAEASLSPEDAERLFKDFKAVAEHRAFIEQAKGMLMFIYGIDAEEAFDMLRVQSQRHNVKLRLIAEQIVKDLSELSTTPEEGRRMATDQLLLTAHQRING